MRVVVLGATRGMGRAVARRLAQRGDELFLLGRSVADLEKSARDLELRGAGSEVGVAACDLEEPDGFGAALDAAESGLAGLDAVVVTAGVFGAQEELESDPPALHRLLEVNFTHTVLFCEEARRRLLARGGGRLCVFSSVAGERGRKPVALYGAGKSGLSTYLEALDHKDRSRGLMTICVKPGFVRTSMTAGLEPPPFAGDPDTVAVRVVKAIDRGWPEVYVPAAWRWIMLIIRCLPRWVMRRVGF